LPRAKKHFTEGLEIYALRPTTIIHISKKLPCIIHVKLGNKPHEYLHTQEKKEAHFPTTTFAAP